jgi:hypothetical protein
MGFFSVVGAKRQKHDPAPEVYEYPDIPSIPRPVIYSGLDYDQRPSYKKLEVDARGVETTECLEWGNHRVAEARALLEPIVTRQNERLFRTHHRSLKIARSVAIRFDVHLQKEIWIGEFWTEAPADTHAGGMEIHQLPPFRYPDYADVYNLMSLFGYLLNPRRLLTAEELNKLRLMYPHACGVQLLIGGQLVILFKTESDMRASWSRGICGEIGGLQVVYNVLDCQPSHDPVALGAVVQSFPVDSKDPFASVCLGLKVKMQDGRDAITTATHGFVKVPKKAEKRWRAITASYFDHIKAKLRNFQTPRRETVIPAVARSSSMSLYDSPIGKIVTLFHSNKKIGYIGRTWDRPSRWLPYPAGYKHDLSLIYSDESQLPPMFPRPGIPAIDGWADLGTVLDGAPVFMSSYNTILGDLVKVGTAIRTGQNVISEAHSALVQGTQWVWDGEIMTQSAALIWRITPNRPNQYTPVGGFSGSALCLGRVTNSTVKAVVFQNFEAPYPSGPALGDSRPADYPTFNIKGGFVLPRELLESEIQCLQELAPRNFDSAPTRARKSGDHGRRSFSGAP